MQLTLDDLRKASDPLASLLGADDDTLDMNAALIQGWHQRGVNWVRNDDTQELILLYSPTSDLDQAYELLAVCRAKCGLYHGRAEYANNAYHTLTKEGEPDGFYLHESQAGSHARAVVVLAILGLLGKDGAA